MREEKKFYCENCNQEFSSPNDCQIHEVKCGNKFYLYEQNVSEAVGKIRNDFDTTLKTVSFKCDNEVSSYCDGQYVNYNFTIEFELQNGNIGILNPNIMGAYASTFLTSEEIYEALKNEIIKKMPTEFTGKIMWAYDEGWRVDYIGDIPISEIVDILDGQIVKLSIIDSD